MSLSNLRKSLARRELLVPKLRAFVEAETKAEQLGEQKKSKAVMDDARLSIGCFKARIEEFNHDVDLDRLYFHPSQIGQCLRNLWFKTRPTAKRNVSKDEDPLRTKLIFETGTYIHVLFQNLCERAGYLEKREELIVDHDIGVIGHADGILKIDDKRILLEIKSINSRNFALLGDAPKIENKKQAMTYMKCLGLKHASIVYVEKDKHFVKEYFFDFDEKFWQTQCKNRIERYHHCTEKNEIPDREGESVKAMPCLFCEFSEMCFDSRELARFHADNETSNPDPECKFHLKLYEAKARKSKTKKAGKGKKVVSGKKGDRPAGLYSPRKRGLLANAKRRVSP